MDVCPYRRDVPGPDELMYGRQAVRLLTVVLAAFLVVPPGATAVFASAVPTTEYGYDGRLATSDTPRASSAEGPHDQDIRASAIATRRSDRSYDDTRNRARASARPGDYGSAPNTAGSVADDVLTPRPRFRTGTVDDAWANATPGPNGGRLCPTCGDELMVPPRSGPRDWDIDHQPPWSQRTGPLSENPNLTRADVIEEFQRGTRLECPGCNRGRGARPL